MERRTIDTKINEDEVRHRTVIEGDECIAGTPESHYYFCVMLRMMGDDPNILNCGYNRPQKIRIYHDGSKWVIEAEATVRSESESN